MSPYVYSSNNPIVLKDPQGLSDYFDPSDGSYLGHTNDDIDEFRMINTDQFNNFQSQDWSNLGGIDAMNTATYDNSSLFDWNSDIGLVTRTVYAEARGCNYYEKEAVADVIDNRVKAGGKSVENVIYKPYQFTSVTGKNDPNRVAFDDPMTNSSNNKASRTSLIETITASIRALISGNDPTEGATMYYSPRSMGGKLPNWNFNKLLEIQVFGVRENYFKFYKNKK